MSKPRTLFWMSAVIAAAYVIWRWQKQRLTELDRTRVQGTSGSTHAGSLRTNSTLPQTSRTAQKKPTSSQQVTRRLVATRVHKGEPPKVEKEVQPHFGETKTAEPAEHADASVPSEPVVHDTGTAPVLPTLTESATPEKSELSQPEAKLIVAAAPEEPAPTESAHISDVASSEETGQPEEVNASEATPSTTEATLAHGDEQTELEQQPAALDANISEQDTTNIHTEETYAETETSETDNETEIRTEETHTETETSETDNEEEEETPKESDSDNTDASADEDKPMPTRSSRNRRRHKPASSSKS